MTNPTPPLTAEEFDNIEELTPDVLDYFLREIWGKKTVSVVHFYGLGGERWTRHPVIDLFKAYAAQQNAELVSENESRKLLLNAAVCNEQYLQAENERLKQQLVGFRNASQKALSQPAEYIDLLNMFHDTQPPKEGE